MKKLIKTKIKKVFSSVLPLAFLFVTMCSGNIAHAAWTNINVLKNDGSAIDQDVKGGATVDYTGTIADSAGTATSSKGSIKYEAGILKLDGLDLTTTHGLIDATAGASEVLTIELVGDNKITSSAAAIKVTSGSIKFTGSGSLTITQGTAGSAISTVTAGNIEFAQTGKITIAQGAAAAAIGSVADLTLTSGTVQVAQTGSATAVNAGALCNLYGGLLTIDQQTNNSALASTGAFTMSEGNVTISQEGDSIAVNLAGSVTLTGGELNIIQASDKNAMYCTGSYNQSGGTVDIAQHGGDNALSFNDTFTMSGGMLTAISVADADGALHFKGDATISGGQIVAGINSSSNTSSDPIYLDASKTLTISKAAVASLNMGGPHGIGAGTGASIVVNKGSLIESFGNTNGIQLDVLALDNTVSWTAAVGAKVDGDHQLISVNTPTDLGTHKYVKLYNASTLAPATSVFDKNTAAKEHTEITVGLDLNSNKLTGISLGDTQLTSGKEFHENIAAGASDPSSVTFQVREFLDTLPVGTHTLTFAFDNSTTADFALEVVDTTNSGGAQAGDNAQGGANQAGDNAQGGNTSKKDTVPKTGDESNIMLYVMLLTAGLFSLVLASKKKLFSK